MKTAFRFLMVAVLALGLAWMGCDSSKDEDDPGVDTTEPGEDTGSEPDVVGEEDTPPPDPCDETCMAVDCGAVDDCDCGVCEAGSACEENLCVCQPACGDDVCGDDGCGGSCGECDEGGCYEGVCVDICFPPGEEPAFSDLVFKINHLEIGEGGLPGFAMDVDDDPDTCAPDGACQDGLDNALGGLLDQIGQYIDVNAELVTSLDEGTIILLAEAVGLAVDGSEFLVNFYLGAAVEDQATCDWQTEVCDYRADLESFHPVDCTPLIFFDNATIMDGQFTAGGPDAVFSITIPLDAGLVLTANAYMARLQAIANVDGDVLLALTDGVVGGAVDKQELLDTCMAVPDEVFADFGIGKDLICNMLDMFIVPDIDRDGDDELDSASVGIAFGTIPGTITGLFENLLEE